ncbi:hypothetical protein DEGR_10990 [Deinococcus grandis]|nr:hypothetical protein DEGR_10990 [Deinococcus grandis]
MTGPRKTPPAPKDPAVEAEFLRKTVLGILSVLETKGLLSTQEVDGILRAANALDAQGRLWLSSITWGVGAAQTQVFALLVSYAPLTLPAKRIM